MKNQLSNVILKEEGVDFSNSEFHSLLNTKVIYCDVETTGLIPARDRLCKLQLYDGLNLFIFSFDKDNCISNLKKLKSILEDPDIKKVFHYARFDTSFLLKNSININNLFCTKVASRIIRTYTQKHSLKDLCKEILKIQISKDFQQSDWGKKLSAIDSKGLDYLINDVKFLPEIKRFLDNIMHRENKEKIVLKTMNLIKIISELDLHGFNIETLFLPFEKSL